MATTTFSPQITESLGGLKDVAEALGSLPADVDPQMGAEGVAHQSRTDVEQSEVSRVVADHEKRVVLESRSVGATSLRGAEVAPPQGLGYLPNALKRLSEIADSPKHRHRGVAASILRNHQQR